MTQPELKTSRILIVDDILDNLNMLTDLLQELGYEVQMAMSGKDALKAVEKNPPDLILLDIQMPVMDGYQVCQRLKAQPETRDIPVIFLSALNETRDILRGFEVGGVDYVSKPFQFREVVARVQSQLNQVNQRREIAELREKDRQQFEQLSKTRELFFRASVHDLKNPLTGIILYSQKMRMLEQHEFEQIPDIASGINNSAYKMLNLITDLLDLAQMQVGDSVNHSQGDIIRVLNKSLETTGILAEKQSINLTVDAPDSKVMLKMDDKQIERLFDNLISNAIKYTPEGGQVHVSLKPCEGYIEIMVEDNGLGIPEEDVDHLFEAFFRVKRSSHSAKPGSGLGLSIVEAIVKQHNGNIRVQSKLGVGSTFIVELPVE
jgi:two-component system sensor histidine kinase/response regulator